MGQEAAEGGGGGGPEQLSGVAVVIIIAVGVQTFIMLFIFAKRQIMRFTLRSRRGPHVSVGQGGVKSFRREIDRQVSRAGDTKTNFAKKYNSMECEFNLNGYPCLQASGLRESHQVRAHPEQARPG